MSAQGMTETVLITTLAAALRADGSYGHANWKGPALREWIKGIAKELSAQSSAADALAAPAWADCPEVSGATCASRAECSSGCVCTSGAQEGCGE